MGTVFGAVVAITDLTQRLRRVVLDVPDLAALGLPDAGDAAVGIYFPRSGENCPPAMEYRDGVWDYYDPDVSPQGRNYTVRLRGPGPRQITCDFVVHERGVASDWVRSVRRGDQIVLSHARSWYRPPAGTDWQLLVADLSGLPAVARIIDELPPGARATVIVEVGDASDVAYLPRRDDVEMVTSVGTGNGYADSALTTLVQGFDHPNGRGYCWFAGEALPSRQIRKHLRSAHGFTADQFDIVGYWRFDSETWDRKFESMSDELVAVYERALADGKGDKVASEEFDLALERAGL